MKDVIDKDITRRAEGIVKHLKPWINEHNLKAYYIAGSCLTRRSSDIDLFPSKGTNAILPDGWVVSTRNAITYAVNGKSVQICKYRHPTLKDLVDSFDFAHIQAGAAVAENCVQETYHTDAFAGWRAIGDSNYEGSEYPLSSLIRIAKYRGYGEISRHQAIIATIGTLIDIIKRGYRDYEDFKDQLDAVDLGLLMEETAALEKAKFMELFEMLEKP